MMTMTVTLIFDPYTQFPAKKKLCYVQKNKLELSLLFFLLILFISVITVIIIIISVIIKTFLWRCEFGDTVAL